MIETTKVYAFSSIHFSDLFNYGSFLSIGWQTGSPAPPQAFGLLCFWVQVFSSPQQPAKKITVHLGES